MAAGEPAAQRHLQALDDALGNFLLHADDIGHLPLVDARPDTAVVRLDEVRVDAKTVPLLAHGAFEDDIDVELPADRFDFRRLPQGAHRGNPGSHAQPADLRQAGDQFLNEAVAEVLDVVFGPEAHERKYG